MATLKGHSSDVTSCAISPDGRRIVSASWDATLKTWDMESGAELATLEGHSDRVTSCAFFPDGRRIASVSADKCLKIWDMETCAEVTTLKQESDYDKYIAISSDGRSIITASWAKTLKVWDTKSYKKAATFITEGKCSSIGIKLPNLVVVGDKTGNIYILQEEGIQCDRPIITAIKLYSFEKGTWDNKATSLCEWCGKRFAPNDKIIDAICSFNSHLSPNQSPCIELPPETWDEPILLSECPHCNNLLRFNPFLVDNSLRY